jgi:quinohemoprotein ethanol dehydrogenase
LLLAVLSIVLTAASDGPRTPSGAERFGAVDGTRLGAGAGEAGNWFLDGADWRKSFYSPLESINAKNAGKIGFAWQFKTGTYRGMEATPVVVDGVMYVTGTWGVVYALNAVMGKLIWSFDPRNDGMAGRVACCDVVNRGVAVWKGVVYVGSMDGRLFALDATTGRKIWVVDTIEDHSQPYTSTGTPLIAGGAVVIGIGGGDQGKGGVRGYVTAYDLTTGAQVWRFHTVPDSHGNNPEPEMKAAAATWDSAISPDIRRGGTVWNGMAYDPELKLVYFGTGNPSPYQPYDRNPSGGRFDALYSDCIVALDAGTGKLAWYFQTTPDDSWDFDATATLILADLPIDGKPRKVVLQANKNGYFYVLDRKSGQPLSAKPFSTINWSDGLDGKFRPIVSKQADYVGGPKMIYPTTFGAHAWMPMSYNPKTGLVYIPVMDMPNMLVDLGHNPGAKVKYIEGFFNTVAPAVDLDWNSADQAEFWGKLPDVPAKDPKTGKSWVRGVLRAWDPVKQKLVWQQETSVGYLTMDGGVSSTAGNLVFAGREDGGFVVYAADTGKILKQLDTGSSIMAAPSVYAVNGEEYVAVLSGRGGASISLPASKLAAAGKYINEDRIIVFKLGGASEVPKPEQIVNEPFRKPPDLRASAEDVAAGERLFISQCSRCHVFGTNITPDLRYLNDGTDGLDAFKSIVLRGAMLPMGMGRFDDILSEKDAELIHAYLVSEAIKAYQEQEKHRN